MNIVNKILRGDKVIWILSLLLGIISLVVVYSAASALVVRNYEGSTGRMLIKHAGTLLLGFIMMFIAYKIDYRHFAQIFTIIMWLCIPLLLYTMLFGNNLNQASRTINILGFSFQPSEWAKIALLTYLSRELVIMGEHLKNFKQVLLKIGLPILLITGLIFTENLSTAAILLVACLVLLYIGRVKFTHIMLILAIGVGMLGIYIIFDMAKTKVNNNKAKKEQKELAITNGATTEEFVPRKNRIQTWIGRIDAMFEPKDEDYDPFDDHHYQQTYAKIAVATSSFIGKGPGKSEQRNFLPHPYSDFIFAIIVEEYGLLGALIVLLIYIILFTRVIKIFTKRPNTFGAYMTYSLVFLIIMQAMINMGVSIGLLPVTGQPLPFVSMGGTSMMATGFILGMILSVTKSIEKDELAEKELTTNNTDENGLSVENSD